MRNEEFSKEQGIEIVEEFCQEVSMDFNKILEEVENGTLLIAPWSLSEDGRVQFTLVFSGLNGL